MKTTKLIVSIALVALATSSFGQRPSIKERLFNKQKSEVEFINASYSSNESSWIENWMYDLRSWSENRTTRNASDAPIVCRTINCEEVEIIFDEAINLESWMETAFESGLAEEELFLESWMVNPFESPALDQELVVESWMTTPFDIAEGIEMERWMTAAWI